MTCFTVRIWAIQFNKNWRLYKSQLITLYPHLRQFGSKPEVSMLYGAPARQPPPQLKSNSIENTEQNVLEVFFVRCSDCEWLS